jgi:hypothetical protein
MASLAPPPDFARLPFLVSNVDLEYSGWSAIARNAARRPPLPGDPGLRRILFLIVAALTTFLFGLIVVTIWEPHTLAKYQTQVGDTTFVLRITNTDGNLYATATTSHGKSGGGHSVTMIGPVKEIGATDPRIVETDEPGRIRLSVGSAAIDYDTATSTFKPRKRNP